MIKELLYIALGFILGIWKGEVIVDWVMRLISLF
jgi:hypothetical protein